MRLDRLLYRLCAPSDSATASGAIAIDLRAGAAGITLLRGYVHALWREPEWAASEPRAEDNLRNLLRDVGAAEARFEASRPGAVPGLRRGRVTPFHPASVVRNHFEARITLATTVAVRARAGRDSLRLAIAPHPSCLGPDEKRLVALLASPKRIDELDRAQVAPRARIERLLAFLEAADAIAFGRSPFEVLGLADGAALAEVRRAYKRLARDHHPDLHSDAPDHERRALAERFTEIHAAYRKLVGGS